MARDAAPVVQPIHADIHDRARKLGFIAESYTQTMAGHGVTGRVAWRIGHITEFQGFTDVSAVASGATGADHVDAAMRDALHDLEAVQS